MIQAIALAVNTASFMSPLPDYARVFTPGGRWTPPLGFTPWAGAGLAGCVLLLLVGAAAFRRPSLGSAVPAARSAAA